MTQPPVLSFDRVSKVYCDDLLRSSRYALTDMLFPWRLRGNRQPALRPGEFLALDTASFSVAAGETVAVLGGRRSGKSALAGLAGGLLRAESGTITRSGTAALVNGVTAGMRPMLTLRENATFRAALYGIAATAIDTVVDEALTFAAAQAEADRVIFNLDPLLIRNVGLALALSLRPDLVVFDESLALRGLPDEAAGLTRLILALQGRASLIVSGNRKLVEHVAQRCLVLDRGQLVFDGPTADSFGQLEKLQLGPVVSNAAAFDEDDDEETENDTEDQDAADLSEREALLQETLAAQEAKLEERQQARRLREAKLKRLASTIQAQRIIINGIDLLPNQSRLIAQAGETITFDVELLLGPRLEAKGVNLLLYTSFAKEPLACASLPLTVAPPGEERQLVIKGQLVLPQLQHFRYELALQLDDGQGITRYNMIKLAVIGLYSGQTGQGTGPDLQIRLG